MITSPLPPADTFVQRLDHGVSVVDTGFVRELFDASHLIVANGRGAFVDTGTNNSVPRLVASLARRRGAGEVALLPAFPLSRERSGCLNALVPSEERAHAGSNA